MAKQFNKHEVYETIGEQGTQGVFELRFEIYCIIHSTPGDAK